MCNVLLQYVLLIGFGVFTTKKCVKHQFLVEYAGDLITSTEAEIREDRYEQEVAGIFLYLFGKNFW